MIAFERWFESHPLRQLILQRTPVSSIKHNGSIEKPSKRWAFCLLSSNALHYHPDSGAGKSEGKKSVYPQPAVFLPSSGGEMLVIKKCPLISAGILLCGGGGDILANTA